ncbi:MAG: zinc ABC transporter ATP-binding protein [Candidatus Aminicenantes bacterium]|nr:MAG: zinc ABC transporter ATP-binding protein [Candidatus Aminicenantes bacterium]
MPSAAVDKGRLDVPLIEVKGVYYSYNHLEVLTDVHLNVYSGDFLALIGPNGAGKTTLIKIILKLLKPKRGEIRLFQQKLKDFKDWSLIGYIPQKATHFDPLFPVSVREVVAMNLPQARWYDFWTKKMKEEDVIQALKVVGMENYIDERIGYLSGGQQQRVFIARALVSQPKVLILDEPTTGVDALTQEKFYDLLAKLNKEKGLAIILVTHEIGIINRHINRVACINRRLVYHGSHAEFCQSDFFRQMLAEGHHMIWHKH